MSTLVAAEMTWNSALILTFSFFCAGLTSAQTVTLTSSVEQAGRQAACPGEEVTFTCTVTDAAGLQWIAEPFIPQINPLDFTFLSEVESIQEDNSGNFTAVLTSVTPSGDLTSELTVTATETLNETVVQCSAITSDLNETFIVAAPPSPPQPPVYSVSQHSLNSFTVAVQWESPASDGGVGVDSYTLTGAGITVPLTVLSDQPLMVPLTLSYNEMHMVSITASNCAGESTASLVTIHEVGCGPPPSPLNGSLGDLTSSQEGAVVTFQCNPGLVPSQQMMSVCAANGSWTPDPDELVCREPADCGDPSLPVNGFVMAYGSTLEGTQIVFQCSPGFAPSQQMMSVCVADGRWSPDPAGLVCMLPPPGDCGVPASPTDGTVAYTTTTEGSQATFQCSTGLVPGEVITAVCEESGGGARWSPDPGDLSCDVPPTCLGVLGELSCDDPDADGTCYTASYAVQPDDSVTFTVSARTPGNTWVGLGVSDDRQMPNSDIVLGAADGTNSFIHDRFAFAQDEPPIDDSQDIESASAERVDGVTTITFNRPRNSGDINDTSLDECRFFLFACGGQVNFFSMPPAALTHGMGPTRRAASLERICIPFTECSAATPADSSDQAVVIAVVVVVVIAVSVAVVATVIIVYLCWRKRSSGAFVVKTEAAADVSNDYARVTGRGVEMDSLAKDTCTNGFYDRPDTQKPAAERLENATDGFYSYADTRRLPPPQDKAGEASAEEYSQLQRQNAPKGVIDLSDLTYSHLQTGSGAVRTSLEETSPLPARLEPEGVAPPHPPKSPVSGPPRPARRSRRQTPERNIEIPSRPPKPAPYHGDQ